MKYFLLMLMLSLSSFNARLNGKLHLIIFADTEDVRIGQSCKNDSEKMQAIFKDAAQTTNLEFVPMLFEANNFSKANLEKVFLNEFSPNDVIIFYYSGHGRGSNGKYPTLTLGKSTENKEQRSYDLEKVYQNLRKKGRLQIVMADCCNKEQSEMVAFRGTLLKSRYTNTESFKKKNLTDLFSSFGSILVSSSQKEQFAWNTNEGGLYTFAFLENFAVLPQQKPQTDWKEILAASQKATQDLAKQYEKDQIPQFEGELNGEIFSSDNIEIPENEEIAHQNIDKIKEKFKKIANFELNPRTRFDLANDLQKNFAVDAVIIENRGVLGKAVYQAKDFLANLKQSSQIENLEIDNIIFDDKGNIKKVEVSKQLKNH